MAQDRPSDERVGPVSALTEHRSPAAPTAAIERLPPPAYFVGSAIFHYLGPAFAVLLFARVDVLGVAWLRIAAAAVVFAVVRRPWHKFLAADRGAQVNIV